MPDQIEELATLATKETLIGDMIVSLIATMRDGISFYDNAERLSRDAYLGQLYRKMIERREAAVERLLPFATPSRAEVSESERIHMVAERIWTNIKATILESDEVFLFALVDLESRTLAEIETTYDGAPDEDVRWVLRELQTEFSSSFADMRQAQSRWRADIME